MTRRFLNVSTEYGIPPWHIFEDSLNPTPNNEEKDGQNDSNLNTDNSNNDKTNSNENIPNKRNCTYEELRLLILKLCEDENTFLVEAPTSESVFPFSMDTALPYANAALNYDPILPRIRYRLVPKKISETQFWKNYFYRVQLRTLFFLILFLNNFYVDLSLVSCFDYLL